jgi:hypothetical protein
MSNSDAIDYLNDEIDRIVEFNKTTPEQAARRAPHAVGRVRGRRLDRARQLARRVSRPVPRRPLAITGQRRDAGVPTTIAVIALGLAIIAAAVWRDRPALLPTMTVGWSFIAWAPPLSSASPPYSGQSPDPPDRSSSRRVGHRLGRARRAAMTSDRPDPFADEQ